MEGVTSDALISGLKRRGHRQATVASGADDLADQIAATLSAGDLGAGDMVICLGAGDITKTAAGLQAAVEARL